MHSEQQWNTILNASLRIHRSPSIVEAGEEALYALKQVLSADCIELTLLQTAPPHPEFGSNSLQRSLAAGPRRFLHFKASYSEPVSDVETQYFEAIIEHLSCASQHLPAPSDENPPATSVPAIRMKR